MSNIIEEQLESTDNAKILNRQVSNIIEEQLESTDNAKILINIPQDATGCFVAVHIGAGFQSYSKAPAYRSVCEDICTHVIELLKNNYSARDAVAAAVALLEV